MLYYDSSCTGIPLGKSLDVLHNCHSSVSSGRLRSVLTGEHVVAAHLKSGTLQVKERVVCADRSKMEITQSSFLHQRKLDDLRGLRSMHFAILTFKRLVSLLLWKIPAAFDTRGHMVVL